MDPAVNTVLNSIPMPDYVLDAVRSINGVKYAVPLYSGAALVKLHDGTYQPVTVIGLDDASLFGRPELLEGNIDDIFAENGFIVVKDEEFPKLENPKLGTEFELNDHRGVIVGIAKVADWRAVRHADALHHLQSGDSVHTRRRASPLHTFWWSPRPTLISAYIKQQVARLGYLALTNAEFQDRISDYLKYQTGIGTNTLLMTVISFIVGLSISGQTFYTFILENLEHFGALKAIGAKGRELVYMILFQAAFTSLAGYGLGIGLSTLLITAAKLRLPEYASRVTYHQPRPGLPPGSDNRECFQLRGNTPSTENRTVRYLSGVDMPGAAIVADKLTKWFGQGETRTYAVKRSEFRGRIGARCST